MAARPRTIAEFLELGGQVRVIAHRGFSGRAPENTLAAFSKAIDVGADMIELDVHKSKDNELVVIHESDLSHTTNGTGEVSDLTLAQLQRLDAGSSFSAEFAGQRIPTLSQVLELIQGRILLNVEIKVADEQITKMVIALIHERRLQDQVILSSCEPRVLRHARTIDSEVRTASLYNERLHAGKGPVQIMKEVGSVALNLRHDQVTADVVAECHAHGRPVAVYTANERSRMRALIAWRIDAIFTNRPDLMIGLVR